MASPYSSPSEIDALVNAGMLDPMVGQRAKDQYFPAPAPTAPMVAQAPASTAAAFNPAAEGPMAPSEGMMGTPATPVANPMAAMPSTVTTSKSESQRTRIDPTALAEGQKAIGDYAESAKTLMEATAAQNNAIAEQKAALAQRRFDDVEKEAAQRKLETDALEARRQEMRSEIDKLTSQKVDSGRFYQNMSTGDKVLAAVSVALGGFASAMQGRPGENAALKIIDTAVERDINEQIKNLENARQVTQLKDQDLMRLIQITGSKQAARDALMSKQYEALAAQIDAKAAQSSDSIIQARAAALSNELKMKAAERRMELEKNVTSYTSATQPFAKAGEHLPAETAKDAGNNNAAQKAVKDLQNMGAKLGTGFIKGKLEQIKEKGGKMDPEMAKLQSELSLAAATVGKSLFGNMSESERKIAMTQIFPQITDGPEQFQAKLSGVLDRLKQQELSQAESLAKSGYRVTPPAPAIREKTLGK